MQFIKIISTILKNQLINLLIVMKNMCLSFYEIWNFKFNEVFIEKKMFIQCDTFSMMFDKFKI